MCACVPACVRVRARACVSAHACVCVYVCVPVRLCAFTCAHVCACVRLYEGLTNCTFQVSLRVDCYWPNRAVDGLFMDVHRLYFRDCALTGRLLRDPPIGVLGPFIAAPLLVTLLVTSLVVWRSQRSEGIL